MSKIKDIKAREILDSRGNPTIEVDIILDNGKLARASVPSGASTGSKEALELRDNDLSRYMGKGVLKAVKNVNILKEYLIGMETGNQKELDNKLIKLDGTDSKSKYGANAILGISLAYLKASSLDKNIPLYKYVGSNYSMPKAMMNILNGGVHADNDLDFQEFMIVPNAETFSKRLQIGSEVFHTLKKVLEKEGYQTAVGDEGGFAPNIKTNEEALDFIIKAIKEAGYEPSKDVNIALDVAASEFYKDGIYYLKGAGLKLTTDELIDYYQTLLDKYPIISIEDPLDENN